MKPVVLSTILFLLGSSAAYANEAESSSSDVQSYCEQQAEMSGIEDAGEKARYLKDCIDSFSVPSVDNQPTGE